MTDQTGPDQTTPTSLVRPDVRRAPTNPVQTGVVGQTANLAHNEPDRSDAARADRSKRIAAVMTGPHRLLRAFYGIVLTIALVGQADAAKHWLHWHLIFAAGAVLALEVGGVAVSAYADARRRLGERAIIARLVSAGLATFAVTVNWQGHLDTKGNPTLQAYFFAGFSLVGYVVWLVDTSARRRDWLRISGDLAATPPSYEWGLWLRHPAITSRARELGKAHPGLGRTRSWSLARDEIRREKRNAQLAAEVRELITTSADKRMAAIASLTFDLDEVADRIADRADYDGLADALSARLTADRLAGPDAGQSGRRRRGRKADRTGPDQERRTATADRTKPALAALDRTEQTSLTRDAEPVRALRAVQSNRLTLDERIAILDRIYKGEIPSRAKVMARTGWNSASETAKAINGAREKRGQSSPDQSNRAEPDDAENVS
jgi:hypothetical protein